MSLVSSLGEKYALPRMRPLRAGWVLNKLWACRCTKLHTSWKIFNHIQFRTSHLSIFRMRRQNYFRSFLPSSVTDHLFSVCIKGNGCENCPDIKLYDRYNSDIKKRNSIANLSTLPLVLYTFSLLSSIKYIWHQHHRLYDTCWDVVREITDCGKQLCETKFYKEASHMSAQVVWHS